MYEDTDEETYSYWMSGGECYTTIDFEKKKERIFL